MTDQEEETASQQEEARHSRATGGDAPAAGSVADREAVAAGEDDLFEDDEQPLEGEEPAGRAPDAPAAEEDPPDASAAVEPPD